VNVFKRHATTTNFSEVLSRGPQGLHFSGHGEKEALILETDDCIAQRLYQSELSGLLSKMKTKLKFVFVAACHSEQAKDVFLNAGAEHVIVIDKQEIIMDKAILTFTHTFYSRIWQPGATVCDAFEQAVTDVRIANRSEEKKFKLETRDGHDCANCPIFSTCEKSVP
jgi:hypothetical protein